MTPDWQATLDEFETALAHQESALLSGRGEDIVAYEPPVELPPMPAELAQRASRLLDRARAFESAVGSALASTSRQLRLAESMTRDASSTQGGSFIDARS